MGLNCLPEATEDVIQKMSLIHTLVAWLSIFRGNYLKNHPDFNLLSGSRWLQADPHSCKPQALDMAK